MHEFRRGGERFLLHARLERASLAQSQQHTDDGMATVARDGIVGKT